MVQQFCGVILVLDGDSLAMIFYVSDVVRYVNKDPKMGSIEEAMDSL